MAKNTFTDNATPIVQIGFAAQTKNDYANSPIGDHILNVEYDLLKRKTGPVSMEG